MARPETRLPVDLEDARLDTQAKIASRSREEKSRIVVALFSSGTLCWQMVRSHREDFQGKNMGPKGFVAR